ncbi:MAG TPA: Lrp/AsnC family transcriptional regulator [Azospirillaceae bacterium]|nr:Lrp/AsnC family transcriptional regulator [Azospirillaceae bacterium]
MPPMLDRLDFRILALLEANGRASFADIAEAVGLSKTPCWSRVQALQEAGVILGYRSDLSRARLGLTILCFVDVAIELDRHGAFEAAVVGLDSVIECHTTVGSSDYVLRVVARDVGHLDDILRHQLSQLPGVKSFTTRICLKSIKEGGSLVSCAAP